MTFQFMLLVFTVEKLKCVHALQPTARGLQENFLKMLQPFVKLIYAQSLQQGTHPCIRADCIQSKSLSSSSFLSVVLFDHRRAACIQLLWAGLMEERMDLKSCNSAKVCRCGGNGSCLLLTSFQNHRANKGTQSRFSVSAVESSLNSCKALNA